MIDYLDEAQVRHAEAQLTDRERIALGGYIMMRGMVKDIDILAYCCSRPMPPKAKDGLLKKKAIDWLASDPARAFLHLWETKAKKEGAEGITEEKTETEIMLDELDLLSREASSLDDKIKIIKTKADIRHKNRSELTNETTSVNFYLPQRCNAKECPLYEEAVRRLQLQDKSFERKFKEYEQQQKAD